MNVGDLVKVISENNEYYGEIGIVTELLNDGMFVYVKVQSGEFMFIPITLEVIA
jgi:hypothetical protein